MLSFGLILGSKRQEKYNKLQEKITKFRFCEGPPFKKKFLKRQENVLSILL